MSKMNLYNSSGEEELDTEAEDILDELTSPPLQDISLTRLLMSQIKSRLWKVPPHSQQVQVINQLSIFCLWKYFWTSTVKYPRVKWQRKIHVMTISFGVIFWVLSCNLMPWVNLHVYPPAHFTWYYLYISIEELSSSSNIH